MSGRRLAMQDVTQCEELVHLIALIRDDPSIFAGRVEIHLTVFVA